MAYADPPYPGFAARLYADQPTYAGEVDHAALIASLVDRYDGWALSTGAYALRDLLPLCPPQARVCAWVKPIGVSSKTWGIHNAWEPLIVVAGRSRRPGKRDWLAAQPARGGGDLPGRKPVAFCAWLFEMLGLEPGDQLDDLFPGTGIVSRAFAELSAAPRLDGSRGAVTTPAELLRAASHVTDLGDLGQAESRQDCGVTELGPGNAAQSRVTHRATRTAAASHADLCQEIAGNGATLQYCVADLPDQRDPPEPGGLVLSLFPGIDLLGRGFELAGYVVVRGPDLLFGQDVRNFKLAAGLVDGIIAGPPCQDFSRARRAPPTGNGIAMLAEFVRLVGEGQPSWWLVENVVGVPDVVADGYHVQRFNVRASEFGLAQRRNRRFQFGSRDGVPLHIPRQSVTGRRLTKCAMASEGKRSHRRTWSEFVQLQGLPADFELPGWSLSAKYQAVGNGVPVPMARDLAIAIKRRLVTERVRLCGCECGRAVDGKATYATPACRKRMERQRRRLFSEGPQQ